MSPLRAFIVRPFGIKQGVDFDRVEQELVAPALDRLGMRGRTTAEILEQGNIRVDMFERLLTADLVIADVTIHNANVFYELGIRHALRDKRTFLIRGTVDAAVPFDLSTDRYLAYDGANPGAKVSVLAAALRSTLASDDRDSPVFQLLPDLTPVDPTRFITVPKVFLDDVERAERAKLKGDLELLSSETRGCAWERQALRAVGYAQFRLKAYDGARESWEAVRVFDPLDKEANTLLGTVYQRLALEVPPEHSTRRDELMGLSEQALRRVLSRADTTPNERAEAFALIGRNVKSRWLEDWRALEGDARGAAALRSPSLVRAVELYESGFRESLNHFFSGLNALALRTVMLELAKLFPAVWSEAFASEADARRAFRQCAARQATLANGVELALEAAVAKAANAPDVWLEISRADLACLTAKRAAGIGAAYRRALTGAPAFAADAARDQLLIYQQLGVLHANVEAALAAMPGAVPAGDRAATAAKAFTILFSGHRLDDPGRKAPRFPASMEPVASDAIRRAVETEMRKAGGREVRGVGGAASGGDILFHEVCRELGIPTTLFLALPRRLYIAESVQDAGPQWVERFDALLSAGPFRILGSTADPPRWWPDRADYSVWQRSNLWMLHHALAEGGGNAAFIALWNGQVGDGPGGTEHMISLAKARGAKTIVLDTKTLFQGTANELRA